MLLKNLEHATGIDTFDLVDKKDFIALKDEITELGITKLTSVPTNFKTNVDDLHVVKSKTVPVDLKQLNDLVHNEVVKTQNLTH